MTYSHRNGQTKPPTEAGWYGIEDVRYGHGNHLVVFVAQWEGQLCQMNWMPPMPIEGVTYLRWWGPWAPWEAHA